MAYSTNNRGCGASTPGGVCSASSIAYEDTVEGFDDEDDYYSASDFSEYSDSPGVNSSIEDRKSFLGSPTITNCPHIDPIEYYTNEPPEVGGICKRTCGKSRKRLGISPQERSDFYRDLTPLRPAPTGPPDPGVCGLDMGAVYARPNMPRDARQNIPSGTVQRTVRRLERTRGIPPLRTQMDEYADDEVGEWYGGQFQPHESPNMAAARAEVQRRGGLEAYMKYGTFRPKCGEQ